MGLENRQISKVAVWMPVYNEERHLRAALESVMEQRFKDFTLYVRITILPTHQRQSFGIMAYAFLTNSSL